MFDIGAIKSAADMMLRDHSITRQVTYRQIASAYSEETLRTTESTSDVSARALVAGYSADEVSRSAGAVRAGDRRFMIRADALSGVTPSAKDRIYFEGRWWEVIDMHEIEALGTTVAWAFQGR